MRLRFPRYDNPVLTKEVRSRARGKRAYWILAVFLTIIVGVFLVFYGFALLEGRDSHGYGPDLSDPATIGGLLCTAIFWSLLSLVALLVPAYTCTMLTSEKEQRTYAGMASTALSGRNIVCGKLFTALLFSGLFAAATIPLAAASFMFGGVSPVDVLANYLVIMSVGFLLGGIGILSSAIVGRTIASFIVAYVIAGAVMTMICGIACGAFVLLQSGSNSWEYELPFPSQVLGTAEIWGISFPLWPFYCLLGVLLGLVFVVSAIRALEHVGEDKPIAFGLAAGGTIVSALAILNLLAFSDQLQAPRYPAGILGPTGDTVMAAFIAGLAVVLTAGPLIVLSRGEAGGRGRCVSGGGLWARRLLAPGLPYALLWPAVAALIPCLVAVVQAGVCVRQGQVPGPVPLLSYIPLEPLVAGVLLAGAFVFCQWGVQQLFLAIARDRTRAVIYSYALVFILMAMTVMGLGTLRYQGVTKGVDILYLSPYYAILELAAPWGLDDLSRAVSYALFSEIGDIIDSRGIELASRGMMFAGTPAWVITGGLCLATGLAGLIGAELVARRKRPVVGEQAPAR
jgi:ABC-type transport system involved in multi-copper enzyme maturation permease subunit